MRPVINLNQQHSQIVQFQMKINIILLINGILVLKEGIIYEKVIKHNSGNNNAF